MVAGAGLTAAVTLTDQEQPIARDPARAPGVRLFGPVASGQPLLRAAVSVSAPRPAGGRNPFVMTSAPAEVTGPAPDPVPTARPGRSPKGRNPFLPLIRAVVPETSASSGVNPIGPVPSQLLRRGSTGEGVRALQQQLRARGWRLAVDGMLGPRTESVVRAFQRRHGLVADGLVGPLTRSALRRAG